MTILFVDLLLPAEADLLYFVPPLLPLGVCVDDIRHIENEGNLTFLFPPRPSLLLPP